MRRDAAPAQGGTGGHERRTSGRDETLGTGPIEYVILGFRGNHFTGRVVPELKKLLDAGTIRILDLVFVTKDDDGMTSTFEYEDHGDFALFGELDGEVGGVISQDDIEYAADALEPSSSAALLVWEDTWAAPLVAALVEADGVVLEGGRIPHDLMEAALADLEPAASSAGAWAARDRPCC